MNSISLKETQTEYFIKKGVCYRWQIYIARKKTFFPQEFHQMNHTKQNNHGKTPNKQVKLIIRHFFFICLFQVRQAICFQFPWIEKKTVKYLLFITKILYIWQIKKKEIKTI